MICRTLMPLSFFAGVMSSPVAALTSVERLNLYLNGTDNHEMMEFSFQLDDCTIVSGVTTQHDDGAVQNLLRTFAIGDLDLDEIQPGDLPALGLAGLTLKPRDGAPEFPVVSTMTTPNADVRALYAARGAACEETTCTLQATESGFVMFVGGPEAASRADTVLADLRDLQVECAQTQEGTN